MARRLATYVHVHRLDERGQVVQTVRLGPGDDVPAWAVERIDNPDAWADDERGNGEGGDAPPEPAPPPKGGSGSGRDAWAAYAGAMGVEVPDEATREDIVDTLTAAGVPTEPTS